MMVLENRHEFPYCAGWEALLRLPDAVGNITGIFIVEKSPVGSIDVLPKRIRFTFWEKLGLEVGMAFAKVMAGRKIRSKRDCFFFRGIQCTGKLRGKGLQASICQESFSDIADLEEMREE